MVVGDVGCGKTICAAAAMLFAVQSGRQAALMAPTEILARQHASELSDLFGQLGIRCALLIGATTAAQKKKIKAALASPDPGERIDVVIGTQALLSEGVEFAAPGLVVTDEQHRFGVNQRATLSERTNYAHLLVMSATPIPRSLALGLYGDLDISRIDEMPPGRQTVQTVVVDDTYRARLDGFITRQVEEGGQVYVVCPAIDSEEVGEDEVALSDVWSGERILQKEESIPLKSAVQYAAELSERLPGLEIVCLHGKMKPTEKDEIMQRFVSGEAQVLVSTTVIEVGVNVPNATLMIIENAERFGLSQLHQLRGRVGRGKRQSYCVLVKGATRCGENAERRLATMKHQHDGFEIARQDLLQRGPGDFLRGNSDSSIRQSGGIRFRLADQCEDGEFMQIAFDDAKELLAEDAGLCAYPALRARMERMFTVDLGVLN
jgi:ATP-dependent DNA helicase RecG